MVRRRTLHIHPPGINCVGCACAPFLIGQCLHRFKTKCGFKKHSPLSCSHFICCVTSKWRRLMSNYRRTPEAGGTYFMTVVAHGRRPILCEEPVRFALSEGIKRVKSEHPFEIDAWVLLPDHLHCIWSLPEGDKDLGRRWGKIKRYVTWACQKEWGLTEVMMTSSRERRGEGSIWQRRFWEHTIRDERGFQTPYGLRSLESRETRLRGSGG